MEGLHGSQARRLKFGHIGYKPSNPLQKIEEGHIIVGVWGVGVRVFWRVFLFSRYTVRYKVLPAYRKKGLTLQNAISYDTCCWPESCITTLHRLNLSPHWVIG